MIIAYIDPGTGALALQLIMASILGAGVYFRRAIARVLGFGRRKKEDEQDREKEA